MKEARNVNGKLFVLILLLTFDQVMSINPNHYMQIRRLLFHHPQYSRLSKFNSLGPKRSATPTDANGLDLSVNLPFDILRRTFIRSINEKEGQGNQMQVGNNQKKNL